MQSRDARQLQAALEEIQQLKGVVEKTQDDMESVKEILEKERADIVTLRNENRRLRSSAHGTSSDQTSIQLLRNRAVDAEVRAEEAVRRAEAAERRNQDDERRLQHWRVRAEELKRRAGVADGAAESMREFHFPDLWKGMEEVYTNCFPEFWKRMEEVYTKKINELNSVGEPESVPESVPKDEGEVDRQSQAGAQASEGEKIDSQDEDGGYAGEDEEFEYQSQQSLQFNDEVEYEAEDEVHSSTSEPNWDITDEEFAAIQAKSPFLWPYGGAPGRGVPPPEPEHDISSSVQYDYQDPPPKPRVRIPGAVDSRSPQQLSPFKGTSSQPLPSPSSSIILQPQQHQPAVHQVGETTRPGHQHTPLVNDTGKMADVPSPLENLSDVQEALDTLGGSPKRTEQDFPDLPKGSSQIPGIPTASTAPPIQKRPTPIPAMQKISWEQLGLTTKKGTRNLPFDSWSSEDESDKDQIPKPEVKAMTSVAAGKQPDRPSPAKEASSAIRSEPPKPTSTQSYAGATVAPPPKVEAGSTQTAQSSRTVLKPGNAAAKPVVPPTDAPPVDQTDENTEGFQTVGTRKPRDSSGRGRGSLGRGEAGSNKGGHQGSTFGNFQYDGKGGRGGNPRGGYRRGGNQGGRQGQART